MYEMSCSLERLRRFMWMKSTWMRRGISSGIKWILCKKKGREALTGASLVTNEEDVVVLS